VSGFEVSVIMPVRDMAAYLPSALGSIFAQSRPVSEIIAIDDRSSDRSREILERFAGEHAFIRIVEGDGGGPSKARNLGLAEARGNVIAFLDADDIWPADKLALQLERLAREPSVDAVWGHTRWFDRQHPAELRPADDARLADTLGVNVGAGVLRRRAIDRLRGFDETLTYSEDVDFVLRLRDAGVPVTALPQIVLYYRRHATSMTTRLTDTEKADFARAIIRSAMRRSGGRGATRPAGAVLRDVLEAV
jgi:glycosyltransferase involved in cell wall biosynthesis